MLLRNLFWFALIYFGYKFVVGFLIPVLSTVFRFKRTMRSFAQEQQQQAQSHDSGKWSNPKNKGTASNAGDYIDFEEIK